MFILANAKSCVRYMSADVDVLKPPSDQELGDCRFIASPLFRLRPKFRLKISGGGWSRPDPSRFVLPSRVNGGKMFGNVPAEVTDGMKERIALMPGFPDSQIGFFMQFDQEKFKSLVHYVIWKAGKHDWFGATKLNKVLWFADARQYALTGRPITGETYIRGEFGPVPRHINRVRKELEAADTIRVTQEGKLTRLVALIPPDTIRFHKDELVTVNYWIEHIDRDHTAGTISEKSHDYAWEIAKMGEELPYYVYRVGRIAEPTDEDVERLKRRASELGLDQVDLLRSFQYEDRATLAINSAAKRWKNVEDIVLAIEWSILHDPLIGRLLNERGIRGFVFPGARSVKEPDVDVLYEDEETQFIVHDLTFREARAQYIGNA